MVFLQFQHSFTNNLIKLSINRMWWEEKCWSVLSSTTLLAKSKEKLIHAPFMLLNSLPWTDPGWTQALVISIFVWCYSEDDRELTMQCAREAFIPWLWYLLNPLQSLGDLVTQVSLFFPFKWTSSGWLQSFPRVIPDETVATSSFKFHIIFLSYAKSGRLGFLLSFFF